LCRAMLLGVRIPFTLVVSGRAGVAYCEASLLGKSREMHAVR
jgi:hypothetical protein